MFVTQNERKWISEFKAHNAVKAITDIVSLAGNRFVGTEGDRLAKEYIIRYFCDIGLDVKETPIEVPSFEDNGAKVTLCADGRNFEAIPAYFSAPTPKRGIEAELVFCGSGSEEDYIGKDVRGKIVVLRESTTGYALFWLGTFAQRAYDKGALGLICIHPCAFPYRMSMESGNCSIANRFEANRLPAVCVSSVDGLTLMHALGAGQGRVRLVSDVKVGMTKSSVVSGFQYGTEFPDERVGICGHRDNGYPPGANDNLSGTATMMEIARICKGHTFKRTLEFISSTAEEGVTAGIYEYVKHNEADLRKNMTAFFDLDMFAGGGKLKMVDVGLWPDCEPIKHDEAMMQMVEKAASDLGYDVGRMTATWGVAESGRLLAIGVPAIWFWRPDDQYYHSANETVENLDGNGLKVVGDLTAVVASKILNK